MESLLAQVEGEREPRTIRIMGPLVVRGSARTAEPRTPAPSDPER